MEETTIFDNMKNRVGVDRFE